MSLYSLLKPVEKEFPFFVISSICIGAEDILRYVLCPSSVPIVSLFSLLLNFSHSVLFAYFFTILVARANSLCKILLYAIIFFLNGIDVFLGMNFGTEISPQVFLLLAETNLRESKEFIDQFFFSRGSLLMIRQILFYVIISFCFECFWKKRGGHFHCKCTQIIIGYACLSIIIAGLFSCERYISLFNIQSSDLLSSWYTNKRLEPHNKFEKLIYSSYALDISANEVHKAIESTVESYSHDAVTTSNDSINVVVVIGESYIKTHCQLYGYELDTTPFLNEERDNGNLFVFEDVISPFNGTSASVKNFLSCNSLSEKEVWYEEPIFPAVFKHAGYKVAFWDNQKEDVSPAIVSLSLSSFLYNKDICRLSYDLTNDCVKHYDADFVEYVNKIKVSSYRNLIIYHLMGQHVDARERFPKEDTWLFFSPDSISRSDSYIDYQKKQEIADYDNATRYNDYVLSLIINKYRYSNTVLIYFSDHGEEIYDYRDHKGRDLNSQSVSYDYLKYQHEIPFVVWCSNSFIERNPYMISEIKSATGNPFMLDNLPHMLFHLGQVETCFYKVKKDVLNSQYVCGSRFVHDADYDFLKENASK